MANITERISNLEKRLKYVEELLGIEPTNILSSNKPDKQEQPVEEMINGYPKSQLLTMFGWAKNTKLQLLSKSDFDELKKWGVLKEFYPNAPDNYEDIKL